MPLARSGDKILASDINSLFKQQADLKSIKVGPNMVAKNFPGGVFLDAITSPFQVLYGSVATAWPGGTTTISVTPCKKDGTIASPAPANVNVYLQGLSANATQPTNESLPVQLDAQVGAILMYVSLDGKNYLFTPPSPTVQNTGGTQYMVFQLSGPQGPAIFDNIRMAP